MGTYSPSANYVPGNAVSYNFGVGVGYASFVNTSACTGIAPPLPTLAPSAYWNLLAYASPLGAADLVSPLNYSGTLTNNLIFGYFQAPYYGQAVSSYAYIQSPPVGGSITFDLYQSGTRQGTPLSISAGSNFGGTIFANPITLSAGQFLQAQVTYVGGSLGGTIANYNLVYQSII
jgi:hypothetical protein